jgi:hypothetical protein
MFGIPRIKNSFGDFTIQDVNIFLYFPHHPTKIAHTALLFAAGYLVLAGHYPHASISLSYEPSREGNGGFSPTYASVASCVE